MVFLLDARKVITTKDTKVHGAEPVQMDRSADVVAGIRTRPALQRRTGVASVATQTQFPSL